MVTNLSLRHLSAKAKSIICTLLDAVETTYQRGLKALPLENARIRLTEVEAPFSDPKLDQVLQKLNAIEARVQGLEEQRPTIQQPVQALQEPAGFKPPQPKSTLVVRPSSEQQSTREVFNQIRNLPCPENIKITKLKMKPNHVEVRCDSEANKQELQSYLQGSLKEQVAITEKKPVQWRLMLLNVPQQITEWQVKQALASVDALLEKIKVIQRFRAKRRGCQHWVIICPKRIATKALQAGFVTAGFQRLSVKKYFRVHRCRHCQHINNHHTSECTEETSFCPRCAQPHAEEQCHEESLKCINCFMRNTKMLEDDSIPLEDRFTLPEDHAANSPSCPTYQAIIKGSLSYTE